MDLQQLLVYLLVGAFTGVLAGLFGIGGGTVIVPALILVFGWQHFPDSVLTHLAIGTSLAAISLTSLSAIAVHHRRRAIRQDWVLRLVPAVCIGVWLGGAVASRLNGSFLQLCFGIFLLALAVQMFFSLTPPAPASAQPVSWLPASGAGGLIGFLSALFGIGGGSLTVPFLYWRGVPMANAVATAATLGFPLALTGALSYLWHGLGRPELPAEATGYLYWPALAGLAVTSIGCANLGARLAHALHAHRLRRAFALFLLLMGIYFLGFR